VVVCLRAFPIFQPVFDDVFLFSADTLVRFFYNHNPIPILFPFYSQVKKKQKIIKKFKVFN